MAKIAVSAGLIWLAFRNISIDSLLANLRMVNRMALAAIVLAALVAAPLHAARWALVIAGSDNRMSFFRATQLVYIGYFFSQALPSAIGGDVVRMWCAYRAGLTPAESFNTVVLDRMVGLLVLLLLVAVTLPWLFARMPDTGARTALTLLAAGGLGVLIVLAALAPQGERLAFWRLLRPLARLAILARSVASDHARVLQVITLSASGLALSVTMVYMGARGIAVELSWIDCLVLVPPVLLVSTLPVSIAGWGVRESAMVVALGYAQVHEAAALTVSVLFGLVTAGASLPGLWFWLKGGYRLTEAQAAERF